MSYYFYTIPKNIALILKDKYLLDTFVETGTYTGVTAEWAAKHFAVVHTIECFKEYFVVSEARLSYLNNVNVYLNNSVDILPHVLHEVGVYGRPLIYLDAHWSQGAHYGRPELESVALEEVNILNQWENENHAIVVDDAHKFGTKGWPRKEDVLEALFNNGKRQVKELLDVLIAVPNTFYKYETFFSLVKKDIDAHASLDASAN